MVVAAVAAVDHGWALEGSISPVFGLGWNCSNLTSRLSSSSTVTATEVTRKIRCSPSTFYTTLRHRDLILPLGPGGRLERTLWMKVLDPGRKLDGAQPPVVLFRFSGGAERRHI